MSFPVNDLKYAASPTLPVIDDAYLRYAGTGSVEIPGVKYLAAIEADTRKKLAAEAQSASMERLIKVTFAASNLIGVIERAAADNTSFIAFRGTEKGTEWLDDFEFPAVDFDCGMGTVKVHEGFLKVYELAKDSLMSQLGGIAKTDRVIVTGHSLGAAVATLCALELKGRNLFDNIVCWTFASPRVFHLHTALFDQNIRESMRVQNPVDVVTHVPMVLQGYRHVTGGLAIKPKLKDFHDLNLTYLPGLQAIIAETHRSAAFPSEEQAFREAVLA